MMIANNPKIEIAARKPRTRESPSNLEARFMFKCSPARLAEDGALIARYAVERALTLPAHYHSGLGGKRAEQGAPTGAQLANQNVVVTVGMYAHASLRNIHLST
jgi:hypothetical protein